MCTVSFKVDENVKAQSQEIFDQLGLSFSGALNIFLKSCINNGGIPFELKVPSYKQVILERIKEAENPENLSKEFSSAKELMDSINA